MTSYILAPDAVQDLQDIWDYIATENLDAADRVIDTLFAAFARLAALPGLGHRREDFDRPAPPVLDRRGVSRHLPRGADPH